MREKRFNSDLKRFLDNIVSVLVYKKRVKARSLAYLLYHLVPYLVSCVLQTLFDHVAAEFLKNKREQTAKQLAPHLLTHIPHLEIKNVLDNIVGKWVSDEQASVLGDSQSQHFLLLR